MKLGHFNTLRASRYTSVGLFLEDDAGDSVLLPMKWVPKDVKEGDQVEVFVYLDSEERPIATTLKPKATVGNFAALEVKQVSEVGAFLDWGLEKDLFVPFREQREKMRTGQKYVVYLYLDEKTNRIAASSKIEKFAEKQPKELEPKQKVDLLIANQTPLGYNVIINNRYWGLIYENEVFKNIRTGDSVIGYIKTLRDDGKVDVALEKPGHGSIEPNAEKVLQTLRKNDGFLPLHDKSDPDEITDRLEMSKKAFKKAVGGLYKQKLIKIEEDGIRLA